MRNHGKVLNPLHLVNQTDWNRYVVMGIVPEHERADTAQSAF